MRRPDRTTSSTTEVLYHVPLCPECGRDMEPVPLEDGTGNYLRSCYRAAGGCGASCTVHVARTKPFRWDIARERA